MVIMRVLDKVCCSDLAVMLLAAEKICPAGTQNPPSCPSTLQLSACPANTWPEKPSQADPSCFCWEVCSSWLCVCVCVCVCESILCALLSHRLNFRSQINRCNEKKQKKTKQNRTRRVPVPVKLLSYICCSVLLFWIQEIGLITSHLCNLRNVTYIMSGIFALKTDSSGGRAGCLVIGRWLFWIPAPPGCTRKRPWARCWTQVAPDEQHPPPSVYECEGIYLKSVWTNKLS